jgi:hypothetical protein
MAALATMFVASASISALLAPIALANSYPIHALPVCLAGSDARQVLCGTACAA